MPLIVCREAGSHLIPKRAGDDGLVLAWVALPAVGNLADVDAVVEDFIEGASGERYATGRPPSLTRACPAADFTLIQVFLQFADGAKPHVLAEDLAHGFPLRTH